MKMERRDISTYDIRIERDLTIALAAAIGLQRACTVKVFTRYSLNSDALDVIAMFEDAFYQVDSLSNQTTDFYLQNLCDLVKRMLAKSR